MAMRFVVALFLVFAIACGGKTPNVPDTAVLRFTPRAPQSGPPNVVTAEAGQRLIIVRATLSGPDPCRTLDGELTQMDRELTLRVFIRPMAVVCAQVIGQYAYDAAIERLQPGTYVLQVIHTYPTTGWPTDTVLSQTIEVR